VTDESPTPLDALRTYLELMQDWITAVREGKSTEEYIPVNSAATRENADALEIRLNFLKPEVSGESRCIVNAHLDLTP